MREVDQAPRVNTVSTSSPTVWNLFGLTFCSGFLSRYDASKPSSVRSRGCELSGSTARAGRATMLFDTHEVQPGQLQSKRQGLLLYEMTDASRRKRRAC
jgi:hypothetical protein